MTEATYKRKGLFGLKVQEGWESMASSRLERKLRTHAFDCKQETKSKDYKYIGQVPSVTLPLTSPHL